MSNIWNNQAGLPNQVGQVKLFDPSQFQTQAPTFGGAQSSVQHQTNTQPETHTSWNSWGSWDWNADGSQQQQQQTAQTGPPVSEYQAVVTSAGSSDQYYSGSHYSSGWNPSHTGAVNYAEHPNFPTGNASYNDPAQEHQYPSGQFDQSHYPQQQQFQHQQQYSYGQFYDHQQPHQEQLQNQLTNQAEDQQHQAPAYPYYDQPHQNAWENSDTSGQWEDGFTTQLTVGTGHTEADNGAEKSLDQPVQSWKDNSQHPLESNVAPHSHKPEDFPPVGHNDYSNDEDGTVTGFFGCDEDGNVNLDRQARGSADQDHEISSSFNKLLNVNPMHHRTSSDISNASLSTLNISAGEEDEGKEALQKVEDLVKKMEGVELSNRKNNLGLLDPGADDGLVFGQQHRADNNSGYSGHQQQGSDYPYSFNAPPPSLPLNTDARPVSPDGDHPGSAESGGSGISGGSSGLADWEIVPPQSLAKSSSRNLTPDSLSGHSQSDGSSFANRKDALSNQGPLPQVSGRVDENIQVDNVKPESFTHQEAPDNSQGDRRTQKMFAGIDANVKLQEFTVLAAGQPGLSVAPPPSGSAPDFDQHRRDNRPSPLHQGQQPLTNTAARLPPNLPPTTSFPTNNVVLDKSTASYPQPLPNLSKDKDIASLPSKPKISSTPSTNEDGNRASRREFDPNFKAPDSQTAPPKQHARKSSQDSEEIAAATEHRRHHSAFHPVTRPRQTTMSPATTLWDNQDTPRQNILLAPAMPLIIPGLGTAPVGSASSTAAPEPLSSHSKPRTRDFNTSSDSQNHSRDHGPREDRDRGRDGRSRDEKNRSFDSLDEIDAVLDKSRSYRGQKDTKDSRDTRDARYTRDSTYSRDADLGKGDRPLSRSGQYQYERPISRTEGYGRDDSTRYRSSYRDYGDASYDERYDRPRSRQDETRNSRPNSRSVQDAERSRQDYDREREYYNRDRNRAGYGGGYGYENYSRNDYYNEERDKWYRYYKDKEARYARGYYEEYYGAKHADYYQQQQHQARLSSAGRPDAAADRLSSQSQSRGNTPGVAASPAPGVGPSPAPRITPSPGPDYYGRSRPASRTDYNRDYYRNYGYHGYDPYYDVGYGYDPYAYGYGYQDYEDPQHQGYDQGRLTPPKYSYPHMRASFGPNGQLVKVQPNRPADGQPAVVEVQDLQRLLESCPEAEEFKQYPGPLTRTNTHKKDVLLFCQKKAASCSENVSLLDRESAQLLWRFLELLIKQNGMVVGTDLSDLLLEGHEPTTHEYSLQEMKVSQSLDALEEDAGEESVSRDSPATKVTMDKTTIMSAESERERWIDRFRHLLLYGRKKDALECAMKNHLWGHALFLASKMDTRTHANVMTRFANSAMRINDPLQTLYQLMSGRQPAAVTCVVDERWGDWRPHLAMILSNQTSRSDIDRKSIATLGDTLAARGFLHASHFCYLMAQVTFGTFNKKTSKIVLVGSSHNLQMEEFATNEAIQCTEVFEYAQMLGTAGFFLPHFQLYKYLYACRLVDYGMASEALHYLETIAANIQQYPSLFQPSFVKLVYELANRLKYSDPQRFQLSEDAEDPIWLQQLVKISSAFADGSIQPMSGTATPAGFPGTTTSSESGDYNQQGYGQVYGYAGDTSNAQPALAAVAGDAYSQQQLYSGQPGNDSYQSGQGAVANQDYSQADPSQLQQGDNAFVQHQAYGQQTFDYSQWQQQGYQYGGYVEQQQQYAEQPPEQQTLQRKMSAGAAGESTLLAQGEAIQKDSFPESASLQDSRASNHGGNVGAAPVNQMATNTQQGYTGYGFQQHQTPRASFSASETTEEDDDDDEDGDDDVTDAQAAGFDYFNNVGQQKVVAPPNRYRTLSSSSAGSNSRRRRTTSGSSTGSVKAAPYKTPSHQQPMKPMDKQQQGGIAPQGANGSGWFGGLLSKFGRKGKNEMILPDDKNPAIVWDPARKKWVNADGTEEEENTAPPPPKDLDLLGKATLSSAAPPPGISSSNRFSLKSIGNKPQYVDVNNPKPISVPQNLFNMIPPGSTNTAAPPQRFLPGTAPSSNPNTTSNNSNMLTVPSGTDDLSRSSSVSSLSQEIQQYFSEQSAADPPSTTAPAVNSMPVLFNPASLQPGASGAHPAAGPGLKYGQRRAYPK